MTAPSSFSLDGLDPIFQAIEAHRAAEREELSFDAGTFGFTKGAELRRQKRLYAKAERQEKAAAAAMVATIPTSHAGCAAFLFYALGDLLEGGEADWHGPALETARKALERLGGECGP